MIVMPFRPVYRWLNRKWPTSSKVGKLCYILTFFFLRIDKQAIIVRCPLGAIRLLWKSGHAWDEMRRRGVVIALFPQSWKFASMQESSTFKYEWRWVREVAG